MGCLHPSCEPRAATLRCLLVVLATNFSCQGSRPPSPPQEPQEPWKPPPQGRIADRFLCEGKQSPNVHMWAVERIHPSLACPRGS
jgi:hypothetical protein